MVNTLIVPHINKCGINLEIYRVSLKNIVSLKEVIEQVKKQLSSQHDIKCTYRMN
jgi:hypothetical protein